MRDHTYELLDLYCPGDTYCFTNKGIIYLGYASYQLRDIRRMTDEENTVFTAYDDLCHEEIIPMFLQHERATWVIAL